MQIILNHQQIEQKIIRIGHQLMENCFEEERIFIGGIAGNGSIIAQKLTKIIRENSAIEVTAAINTCNLAITTPFFSEAVY